MSPDSWVKALNNSIPDVWNRWTEPDSGVADPRERQRARVLSASLLIILAVTIPLTVVVALTAMRMLFVLAMVALVSVIIAYGLSRTRYIALAASIGLVTINAVAFAAVLINPTHIYPLAFLLNGILLCTLYFNIRVAVALTVIDVIGLWLLLGFSTQMTVLAVAVMTTFLVSGSGLMLVIQSIRQRDQAQLESQARFLAENERLYRLIAENATDMISRHSLDAIFLYVSPSCTALLGYQPEEIIGRSAYDFFHPDDEADVNISHKNILEQPSTHTVTYRIRRKDGSYIWFETTSKVIRDTTTGEPLEIIAVSRDVTGRKMVEEVITDSEARFRAAAEGSLDAFFLFQSDRDENGKITDFIFTELNRNAEKMIAMTREQVIGQRLGELIPVNRTDGFIDKYIRVVETGVPLEEEFPIETPQIEAAWLHHQVIRVGDGIAITSRDVTERKRTEAEIQQAKRLLEASYDTLRRLIQQMPIGVQVFDTHGLCTDVNSAHERIFGIDRDRLVGKFNILTDILAEKTGTRAGYEQALKGEVALLGEIEFDFAEADPRFTATTGRRYVSVSFFPLFDAQGEIDSVVALNEDVTTRHLAEQELKRLAAEISQQKNTLDAVLTATPDRLAIFDREGHYLYANPPAVLATGFQHLKDIQGKTWRDLHGSLDMDRQYELDMEQVFTSGQPVSGSLEYPDPAGTQYVEYTLSPVFDDQGTVMLIVSTNRDVTERRQAEQERLELAVQRERVRMLQHLISDTSHDLKTPLATLNTSLYLLKKSISDPERREKYAEVLQAQVTNLSKILDDMDSMARLDGEQDSFDFVSLDINELLGQIVREHETLALQKNQTLRFMPCEKMPLLSVDDVKLRRAITNLIANALNYTPEGGEIKAQTICRGNYASIEIHDTGLGIPASELPLIFERFYRSETIRKVNANGSGLGLAITKKIIEAHGGKIEAESTPNVGSTFRILLPIQPL
jgi:PAS domain S-box-containing protein